MTVRQTQGAIESLFNDVPVRNPVSQVMTADATPGHEEVASSTTISNEIPGPSGNNTSSCAISPMKFSPMKDTIKEDSLKRFGTKFTPISQLNQYLSDWTIRVRVTHKTEIRNWSNSNGEGKVFSFDVIDKSGEIKITAFNSQVDTFFSLVEPNEVYLISKASLKLANKQFATINNDYEITLCGNSCVLACRGRDVPSTRYRFVPISELEDKDPDVIIDVIAVCQEAGDLAQITTKAGKQLTKRELRLIDSSGKMVTLALWGEQAQTFNAPCHPVVAIKGARLSTFGGRSLTAFHSSILMVNPEIPEAFALRSWYNQEAHAYNFHSLSEFRSKAGEFTTNWKTLSDVETQQLGHGEKADYFNCVATVVFARKKNCLYQSCPTTSCHKKVHQQPNGRFHCDKCGKDYSGFKYRFILCVNLADFGDNTWATCFQDTAENLLGLTAEELGGLRDTVMMRTHSTRFSGKSTSARMSSGTESSWRYSTNKHGGENRMGEGGKSDGTPG
ncbi:replication protein A 70 kDa DNA-binding subunit-like isoform X2 [Stigmatopora argus]